MPVDHLRLKCNVDKKVYKSIISRLESECGIPERDLYKRHANKNGHTKWREVLVNIIGCSKEELSGLVTLIKDTFSKEEINKVERPIRGDNVFKECVASHCMASNDRVAAATAAASAAIPATVVVEKVVEKVVVQTVNVCNHNVPRSECQLCRIQDD